MVWVRQRILAVSWGTPNKDASDYCTEYNTAQPCRCGRGPGHILAPIEISAQTLTLAREAAIKAVGAIDNLLTTIDVPLATLLSHHATTKLPAEIVR